MVMQIKLIVVVVVGWLYSGFFSYLFGVREPGGGGVGVGVEGCHPTREAKKPKKLILSKRKIFKCLFSVTSLASGSVIRIFTP